MKLNKDQINRLYRFFDFDESEEIDAANYIGSGNFVLFIFDSFKNFVWEYNNSKSLTDDEVNFILEGKDYD